MKLRMCASWNHRASARITPTSRIAAAVSVVRRSSRLATVYSAISSATSPSTRNPASHWTNAMPAVTRNTGNGQRERHSSGMAKARSNATLAGRRVAA